MAKTPKEDAPDLKEESLYEKVHGSIEDSLVEYKTIRDGFAEKEAFLLGTLQDEISNISKSKVNDPRLATISIERASRVMAQNPMGKFMGVGDNDAGKNQLMNLTIGKYVLPNADAQWSYLIKSRMWDIYSLMYGAMFSLVDWTVNKKKGYVGPNTWLLPIRDCFPQAGAISINDSDKFNTKTLVGRNYLESLDKKKWDHIDDLITKLNNGEGLSRDDQDGETKSHVESERGTGSIGSKIELETEYRTYGGEKNLGEWITISPQLKGKILRRINNPHMNGELPIVEKYAFPLVDSIYGLGEFERGKSLQYAINSLINLYMDGVKMSIFPPVMINPDGVVRSSIKFGPAAKWLVRSMDAVKQFNLNPQGLQTFNSTYSFLIAALMNQAGTTTTNTSDKVDSAQGKTPQALKMLESRENSRDAWDQFMMEEAQSKVIKKFANLIAKKQSSKITMRLFDDEIKKIAMTHPDVMEFVDGNEVKAKSDTFKGMVFDYQIVPGSTLKADQELQFEGLKSALNSYLEFPQIQEAMAKKGKALDIAELYTRMISKSNIEDWDKIVIDAPPEMQQPQQPAQPQMQQPQMPQQPMQPQMPQQPMQQMPQAPQQPQGDPQIDQAAQEILSMMGGIGGIPPTP